MGRDKSVVVEFDPSTGKEVKELYGNEDYDVGGVAYSRKRKVITAAYWAGAKSKGDLGYWSRMKSNWDFA